MTPRKCKMENPSDNEVDGSQVCKQEPEGMTLTEVRWAGRFLLTAKGITMPRWESY